MKLLEICVNVGIQKELKDILIRNGVDQFIVIPKAVGKLKNSEPMEDDHIWPGYFVIYDVPVDEKMLESLKGSLNAFKKRYKNEGVCVIIQEIEEMI